MTQDEAELTYGYSGRAQSRHHLLTYDPRGSRRTGFNKCTHTVQFTAPEYAEYVVDCAARGKKDEAEKQKELVATIAMAVDAALAARQGLPMITKANVDQKKAKSKKQNLTAPPETDSDAAGDHGSSSDSDSAPPSPASKAKAK